MGALTGKKPKGGGKSKPKPPKPSAAPSAPGKANDPVHEARAEKATAALAEYGVKIHNGKPGTGRIWSKQWADILENVQSEVERLEALYPGTAAPVVIERTMPKPGAGGVYDINTGRITLRPDSSGTEILPGSGLGIPWIVGGGDPASTFRHEMAHAIDWATEAKYRDALKQTIFTNPFDGTQVDTATWAAHNVSTYAGTNTSEAIAELFAAYTSTGYIPGSLPPRVEAILKAMLERSEPPPPEIDEIPGGHIV